MADEDPGPGRQRLGTAAVAVVTICAIALSVVLIDRCAPDEPRVVPRSDVPPGVEPP